jgi:hypothetical protein
MTVYILSKSDKIKFKYVVFIMDSNLNPIKTIYFGANGYEDYTIHHDKKRKERYIKRHQKYENWTDPFTKGFWAKNILWNKRTLISSINSTAKKFNMIIVPLDLFS